MAEAKKKTSKGRKKASRSSRAEAGTLRIELVRSTIGCTPEQRAVIAGLGLRRIRQVVERPNRPEIRGMVAKVPHLVRVVA